MISGLINALKICNPEDLLLLRVVLRLPYPSQIVLKRVRAMELAWDRLLESIENIISLMRY